MILKIKNLILAGLILFSMGFSSPKPLQMLTKTIYSDGLGTGWGDWSWGATLNFAATSPVYSGTRSISVVLSAWGALSIHNPELDPAGMTYLQFAIHGGSTGGQQMKVFFDLTVAGTAQQGPEVTIPQPTANSWSLVRIPLINLNPKNGIITRISWQGTANGSQPVFYLDDIALVSDQSPDGPQLSNGILQPRSLPADGSTIGIVKVTVSDPQGLSDIVSVTLDGSKFGRGTIELRDDGRSNDGAPNDGVFGAVFTIASSTQPGEQQLVITAQDLAGHKNSLILGAMTVLARPGGSIPAGLPQRIGWGTDEWNGTASQDWQVNSGVPWNYVYQYITWGWDSGSWGPNFVSRFVNQAWMKNYIPMVVVYMFLEVPNFCGESPECYVQKLQNSGTVSNYLASLRRAATEAKGNHPVIFALEPDFYGYMQQISNTPNPPNGIRLNDPTSFPVALNINGYPNTLAGFGRYMVDIIHNIAPNALVAPVPSMWGNNEDPQAVDYFEAVDMGRKTAAFVSAMGGAQADAFIVEWSDRDAGSGLRPWWDDTDMALPRPTRAILWENTVSSSANKRLFLWQMPVGNMTLDNTCDHYRDNRAAYAFSHPRDLFDAGVIGVLFGGGKSCMTTASTDGGFVKAQGAIAYAVPAITTGLSAGAVNGVIVPLQWNENSENDLWGYRLEYQQVSTGAVYSFFAGRRNSIDLLLPHAGTWQIRLAAVDAMGNESSKTSPVTVIMNAEADQVYLPVVRR